MNNKNILEDKVIDKSKKFGKSLWNNGKILYSGIPISMIGLFTGSRIGKSVSELFPTEQILLNSQDIQNVTYSLIGGGIGALTGFLLGGYYNKIFKRTYKEK
jgi:hypothetical protein